MAFAHPGPFSLPATKAGNEFILRLTIGGSLPNGQKPSVGFRWI